MGYQNSIFFVPVHLGNYRAFLQALSASPRWEEIPRQEITPRYLLSYARQIAQDSTLYSAFRVSSPEKLQLHMFPSKASFSSQPEILDVRFSCFATDIGFMEFWIRYPEADATAIANFAYHFKRACSEQEADKLSLYDTVRLLIPAQTAAVPFFTANADFKKECLCFHYLCCEAADIDREQLRQDLFRLRRSYSTHFPVDGELGDYDMVYAPYPRDHWSGCPEGMVNIAFSQPDESPRSFLSCYKQDHLQIDYYFAYLLLLNQRFSAISYVQMVAQMTDPTTESLDALNRRIVDLKTKFAFHVISDDRIVQNVYAKMAKVLDINHLLEDLQDNENQIEILQNARSAQVEKRTGQFLAALSGLSLFSALIDAASYFDRIQWLQPIATALSAGLTVVVAGSCLYWIFRKRKK